MDWKTTLTDKGAKVITPVFTAAFASVFQPKAFGKNAKGKQKYSVTMIFPKGQDFAPLTEVIKTVAKKKWGDKADAIVRKQAEGDKRLFKDGSLMVAQNYAGFIEGAVYLQASNEQRPGLVKKVGEKLHHIKEEAEFYSGCMAIAAVSVYAWDNDFGKGVSFSLDNIQKIADGERLGGGRSSPESDFETPMGEETLEDIFG